MSALPVYVLGGWQSDFADKAADGLFGLLQAATLGACEAARIAPEDVESVHVGNLAGEILSNQAQLGGLVASAHPAFAGLPTARHEAACAAGSISVLAAMAEIEAGRYDVVLATGAEILRNVPGQQAGEVLGCAAWADREAVGEEFPWPHLFAQVAAEYERRWGLPHSALGRIAEVNFDNAKRNPNAQTRDWHRPESFGEDESNGPVAGVLRKQDCGRITDGSAGVVLASHPYAERYAASRGLDLGSLPVIAGWGHTTAPMLLADKLRLSADDKYVFPHLRGAAAGALRRAGLPGMEAVDTVEVHDCFTISEYVAIDHLGITEPGLSWQAVEDGTIDFDGRLPVNPSGGLLGLGHPVGATGVRMLLDASKQVTGAAGDYQVPGARTAMTLNIGGSFTTAVSLVVRAAAA